MLRKLSIGWWRFWLAGDGMSVRTGREFTLAALVGLLVGLVTAGFYAVIEICRHYLLEGLGHQASLLSSGEAARSLFAVETFTEPRRWVLFFLPALGAVAGTLLIRWFSPSAYARGTDSAVYAYHRLDGQIPASVIPVKSVASAIVIGSGGSAGYEGPMTLIGAACGSAFSRILGLDVRMRRILMASGLAAGIGALFRAPLAGALFGAEIFYSGMDIEYETLLPSFIASAVAYTVFALFYGWQPLFAMPAYTFDNGVRLLPYIVLAVVVAIGAKFYILVFRNTEGLFRNWDCPVWAKCALGGLLTGAIGLFCPDILGTGYGIIQAAFNVGDADILGRAVSRAGVLSAGAFILFFFAKAIATSCTVGSGGSGGVFGPALVCGGSLGAATGILLARVMPASVGIHPAAFALVGMAGFVAAAIRTPLTAIVMVSEISGNHELLLPTMWVCCIAFWLDNGWTLYRSQVHDRNGSPVHAAGD